MPSIKIEQEPRSIHFRFGDIQIETEMDKGRKRNKTEGDGDEEGERGRGEDGDTYHQTLRKFLYNLLLKANVINEVRSRIKCEDLRISLQISY